MRKKFVESFLVLFLLFMGVLICQKLYVSMNTKSDVSEVTLDSGIVPTTTNFSQDNKPKSDNLESLNKKLSKKHYIGAYMVTDNNSVLESESFGYANFGPHLDFGYNTAIRVGDLQSLINIVIFLQMLKSNDIKMNSRLGKYIPELSKKVNITPQKIIDNSSKLSIKLKTMNGLKESEAISCFFRNVKQNDTTASMKSSQDANNILIAILIRRISGKTYTHILKTFLKEYKLYDSVVLTQVNRIYGRQDVASYEYSVSKNQIPNYDKEYLNVDDSFVFGIDQLRMPIIDIANAMYHINNNVIFKSKEFKRYCATIKPFNGLLNNPSTISIESHGYYVSMIKKNHAEKMVMVIANYPNKMLSPDDLANKVFKIVF